MADRALLTGINNYKSIGDLRGCVNDTISMQQLLTEAFGFKKNAIRVRKDQRVTKEELRKGWEWLLADAKPGDRLVFHFSGHGSYTKDRDGDEDEGVDELLCLYGMDWSDPDSYLLDDEVRQWTDEIPDGVLVTFVFDCCHSGTATRMVMPPASQMTRSMSTQSASLVDLHSSYQRMRHSSGQVKSLSGASESDVAEQVLPEASDQLGPASVLARFAPPPPEVIAAMSRAGSRGGFSKIAKQTAERGADESEASMNHVFWSGSQSDQTSADAYINSDYHGAFTYYFCRTIKNESSEASSQQVIDALRNTLDEEGFSQVPQLEPSNTDDVVFQSDRPTTGNGGSTSGSGTGEPALTAPTGAVWNQILQLLQQIASQMELNVRAPTPPSSQGNRGLVYCHGICVHPPKYSDPWWNAMSPHLKPELRAALDANRHEVLWSKHVSATDRALAAADPATMQREREIEARLRDVLRERASNEVAHEVARSASTDSRAAGARAIQPTGAMPRAAFGIPGLDCIDDFTKYLASDRVRDLVIDEFRDVVRPLLARGDSIAVISHSWGTVVAYEGLRGLESEGLPGRVRNWFTVGAALSIAFVADRLRQTDGRKPMMVDRWVNLDARADFVGGSLQSVGMQVDQEFLDLHPTTCNSFGWPLELYTPACAHSSYFKPENLVVNRDIFAGSINQS